METLGQEMGVHPERDLEAVKQELGNIVLDFWHDERRHGEYRIVDLKNVITVKFPDAEVSLVFRNGGAYEEYFTDNQEGNPQTYWKVRILGEVFFVSKSKQSTEI